MIKSNELRVGNWVNRIVIDEISGNSVNAGFFQISRIGGSWEWVNFIGLYDLKFRVEDIEPILLTPEILEQCGFKRDICLDDNLAMDFLDDSPINSIYFSKGKIFFTGSEYHYTEPKVLYLHQLQNLFFALTGEELTYTP